MERNLLLSSSRSLSRTLANVTSSSSSSCAATTSRRSFSQRVYSLRKPSYSRVSASRCFHAPPPSLYASAPPKSRDRGPKSDEDTQTDFASMDVLRNTARPASSINSCTFDGFSLDNGMQIAGCGILLLGGEVFRWRPWLDANKDGGKADVVSVEDDELTGRLRNAKGQWEVRDEAWGALDLVWPKPDLLIIGTGPQVYPLAPAVRTYLNNLGIRLEIQDTRNAAAQFNLLATERGVSQVAAALIPIGWEEE